MIDENYSDAKFDQLEDDDISKYEEKREEQELTQQIKQINTTNLKTSQVQQVNELEIWKRSEKTKFKLYLQQLEIEHIEKLNKESFEKEEIREKQVKAIILDLQNLLNKTKKKAVELESRENKLTSVEEEIKLKLNEISRQMITKNEEIDQLQKKFKEEKLQFEKEAKLQKQNLIQKTNDLLELENAFRIYRKEVDDSPISVLKMEINKKSVDLEETLREKDRIANDNQKLKQNINRLKEDMINMKKTHDLEKEKMIKQRMEEIEKMKFEIYNQNQANIEMNEINNMKHTLIDLKQKENMTKQNNYIDSNSFNMKNKQYRIITLENKKSNIYEFGKESEIERLSNERNKLLNSGMYTENDRIIIEMDNKIKRLLQNN